jgi:hypothetical protein
MDANLIMASFLNLLKKLPPTFIVADRTYAPVKKKYLLENFYDWYRKFMFSQDVIKWDSRFDCDDFAALYRSLIQLAHFQAKGNNDEGVAVGEVFFWQEGNPDKGHAINCGMTEEGLIFFEPQTGKQLHLSNEELASIFFVRF